MGTAGPVLSTTEDGQKRQHMAEQQGLSQVSKPDTSISGLDLTKNSQR